jgi:hypothetical protein
MYNCWTVKNNGPQWVKAYNSYSIHNIVSKILNFICVKQNAGKFSVMQVHMVDIWVQN